MSDTRPRRGFPLGSLGFGAAAPLAAKEAFDATGFGATHGGSELDTAAVLVAETAVAGSTGALFMEANRTA